MRKSFLVAGTATLALGVAGIAYAQVPPSASPTVTVEKAAISPTKAGTKSKPKAAKLTLDVVANALEGQATVSKITIKLPSTIKVSTKGLDQCTKGDDEIIGSGPKVACSKSVAGTGEANAKLVPYTSTPTNVKFDITTLVGKNEILFYLQAGGIAQVLHGKLSSSKMTIEIPKVLQNPDGAKTFSALADLSTTLKKSKGKSSLISTTGCSGGTHKITATLTYAANPNPPAKPTGSASGTAKCSK